MLKRGFKKMFKDDIILLKEAISIIFENDRLLKERKQEGEIEKDQEESKF